MSRFHESADIFDEGRSWQWRAMRASMGTTAGLIVMAMLAKEPRNGPALGHNCDILLDGKVVSPVRRYGIWGKAEVIGTVRSVRDNLRALADHCKFDDAMREEFFAEFRKWIRKDYRAKSQ